MRVEPNLDWGDVLERSRWHTVLGSKESLAKSMLKTTAFVGLTERKKDDKPFLVRAVGSHVGTAGLECHVRKNGDFIIGGQALSHFHITGRTLRVIHLAPRRPSSCPQNRSLTSGQAI